MKEYSYIVRVLILFGCIALNACEGIFIPDPIDPRIPKYTETGNDVAGALVDDEIWESVDSHYIFPTASVSASVFIIKSDTLELIFHGNTNERTTRIEFHFTDLGIESFEDLYKLDGKKIDLDGVQNLGYYLESDDQYWHNQKGVGQVYFRRIQMIGNSSLILSGTFGFTIEEGINSGTDILHGRFDYRMSKDYDIIREGGD